MTDDETWSIQDVARRAGTTSRTLRHYHRIGLLEPTEVGANGYRRYGTDALVRLQRILLLRELGLSLPAIAELLAGDTDPAAALAAHAADLERVRDRLGRQIASVERTISSLQNGRNPMTHDMFDGFDHTVHEEEVTRRWGADAYRTSSDWWTGLSPEERTGWTERSRTLADDWIAAARGGAEPDSAEAQAIASRHVAWLASIPGTPGAGAAPVRGYLTGLAEMYVADERFAATYGGPQSASLVRDALLVYVERNT